MALLLSWPRLALYCLLQLLKLEVESAAARLMACRESYAHAATGSRHASDHGEWWNITRTAPKYF
jgi:hypothetical protein